MTSQCNAIHCPLCGGENIESFFADKNRAYLRCVRCELVFVPGKYRLSAQEERATYALHQNDARDQGYRQFLTRLSEPLLEKLDTHQHGLDFGCGPGPALSVLLQEQGHQVDLYDPFFFADDSVFDKEYDFICATEVVEHLRDPDKEFSALFGMLKTGGWLGIMTKMVIDRQAFSQWHYIRDMTHICFYSQGTFEYLAKRFNAELEFAASDVILLYKK